MEVRSVWTDLIPGVGLQIAEVFNQAQEEYRPGIFSLLNRVSATQAERNVTGKTGIGRLVKFDDGDDVPERTRYKTYTTRIAANDYGGFIEVSKNTLEDRDFDGVFSETRELSLGANFSQDESGMQLFNGGFATTVAVNGYDMTWYGDGNPLFSTVHATVVPGASTNSNASATGIPFGDDNLETGHVALTLQKTDDGFPVSLMGSPTLVLPINLQKEGMVVTGSSLKSSDASNAINVWNGGMRVNLATSAFLDNTNGGSDTAWYLVVPSRHKLNHEVRQEPRLDQGRSVKNLAVTFVVTARWAESVTDWRRTWGSKGDNAAYAS